MTKPGRRERLFALMNRRLVVASLVSCAIGVGLTFAVLAVVPDKEAASSLRHARRNRSTHAVDWTKVRKLLGRCKVATAEQTHSRLVTLTLKKGRKVTAYEPAFGDIAQELARVRSKCGEVKLSTS